MNYYFISDLHLSEQTIEVLESLQALLLKIKVGSSTSEQVALYILGDFFDYWVGDDITDPFINQVAHMLASAQNEWFQIYFMVGNRDFLMDSQFLKRADLKILPSIYDLTINHQHIRLMHGDLMCLDDRGYLLYRKLTHNCIFKCLFKCLPYRVRHYLADLMRHKSEDKQRYIPSVDVTEAGVKKYGGRGLDLLIHGHTHKMGQHIHLGGRLKRWVLSDWYGKEGSYILYMNGGWKMEKFDDSLK